LVTGFVTTAPGLTRYPQGRGIDPSRRELMGEQPAHSTPEVATAVCDRYGMNVSGTGWAFGQHQQTKGCQKALQAASWST
jgi:hypothetical protein